MSAKSTKMMSFINYRMRITIQDGRQLVGRYVLSSPGLRDEKHLLLSY